LAITWEEGEELSVDKASGPVHPSGCGIVNLGLRTPCASIPVHSEVEQCILDILNRMQTGSSNVRRRRPRERGRGKSKEDLMALSQRGYRVLAVQACEDAQYRPY